MSDWNIACLAMTLLFFLIVFLMLWLSKDQAKIDGKVDFLQKDRQRMREEMDSLRIRLKALEIASKEKSTASAGKCVDGDILGVRAKIGGDEE